MSGESLENAGITSTDDLSMVSPGLEIKQSGVGNVIFLRGLGNQDATGGQEGSVGVYVDGVWYGSVTGSALTLNNIERLEVLKGPQGTLFGRNTTGGVINVITKDPEYETGGSATLSYDNYERVRTTFYGTTGVSENLAADISLMMSDQGEGYGKNLATGNDANKREDEFYVRSKWKYEADRTDVTFAVGYEEFSDDMGYARSVPKGYRDVAGNAAPNDSRDIQNDTDNAADFENTAVSLRVDHRFESVSLVSITGYKDDTLDSLTDNDYTAANILDATVDFYSEALTQEFQLLSNNGGGINWIAGMFFLSSEAGSDITISGPALWYTPAGDPTNLNDQRFYGDIDTTSIAAFGEVEFALTANQSLTLGLRYTRDEREISGAYQLFTYASEPQGKFNGTPQPEMPTPTMDESYSEPTWRIVYDVQLNDDVLLYASYNRGFRSGNFNAVSPERPAFQPETVDAYEIGAKSDLLAGQMRLNGALFFYDAQDLQFQALDGVTAYTINAASAEIKGAEVDMTWLATQRLTLIAAASLIDGEYQDFEGAIAYPPNPAGGTTGQVAIDASGNQLTKTPELEFSLGAIYEVETDKGDFRSDLRIGYNDGYPWEADGRLEQDPYTLVNWSIGWTSPGGVWGLKVLTKNLLDEEYSVHTASSALGDFYASGAPRTVSLMGTYNF